MSLLIDRAFASLSPFIRLLRDKSLGLKLLFLVFVLKFGIYNGEAEASEKYGGSRVGYGIGLPQAGAGAKKETNPIVYRTVDRN